jgi:glycerol-3-phosphate dehydrogenase
MTQALYDLAIIGGGINGAGIAADAAARGLTVVLLEQNDLASATSSASSKLIHGGLRYLEHYDFRLVRQSLQEREVLLAKAPHIIWPLRFVLPHVDGMRPRALIRAGLLLYDHLARRRKIPSSSGLDLLRDPMGRALKPQFAQGFSYWDCWADDARLVVLNARAAAVEGASIQTRSRVTKLSVADGHWKIEVQTATGPGMITSRALVNAAGPWVDVVAQLVSTSERRNLQPRIRLVKGSHIVVPRIEGADDAFLLQSADGRVVFALPYEERFTLIGTTDVPYDADPGAVAISEQEVGYLLDLANSFFAKQLKRGDIVSTFSGVRPLFDDGNANVSAVTRDYRLELASENGAPPLLTVLGGKLTTYRKLAEAAVDRLAPYFPEMRECTTATDLLPGGDTGAGGIEGYREAAYCKWPGIPAATLDTLIRRYGTLTDELLGDAKSIADLGEYLGGGLYEREAAYLRDHEWATEPGDVLWRRTKAGLHMSAKELQIAQDRLTKIL